MSMVNFHFGNYWGENMTSLGIRLIKLRKSKNLNQKDAAKFIGISAVNLSRYEKEQRTPDMAMINKLADFYEVHPSYLLFGKNKIDHFDFLQDITEEEALLLKNYLAEIRDKKE